ncbi:hypothetical protein [uncultured Methanobrevibacter sp.]|uniref:hypothetical protein n=1 Tax=uncultured Methanobrevibacter sp. TaxID=253161 RepID=UPI0025D754D7|nr:hypothetical protein [uncultured Methanobrevibacter sp.]
MDYFIDYLEDQFFIIDSYNLDSIEERLYGFSVNNNRIIENKDIIKNISLDATGAYIFVEVDEENIKISQDFNGSYGIYIYKNKDYFAISNSFVKLVDYLKHFHVLTLNKDYADAFLFADLVSFAYCDTLVNEINLIPRNYIININKNDLSIDFSEIDYQEKTVSLNSKEGIELLDKWYYKWVNIIRNIKRNTNNLIFDLSGGFDSRVIATLWLTSNIDLDKIKIESGKNHYEDFEIASKIGKFFNFKLNQDLVNTKFILFNDINTPLNISFYVRLGFHKRMIFESYITSKPIYHFTGAGGASLRDSNQYPEEYLDNMKIRLNRDDLAFFNPSKRVILKSWDKLSKKFKIDINSSEITQIHRSEVRDRNHFGKNTVTRYLINHFLVNPLFDPIIRRLKLKTDDCNDNNLLFAIIFSRYCPELLNFKFDGNREIQLDTLDYAFNLNEKYPFVQKDFDFISGPEIIRNISFENLTKHITREDVYIFLRDNFLSNSFKMEFKKHYSDYDYNIISNKLNQDVENSFKSIYSEIHSSIAIIKIANDCTFSQLNSKNIRSWFNQFKQNSEVIHLNQDNLIKYNAARIQIRNMNKGNSIEIIDYKGINKISAPKWFQGKTGKGLVIHSFDNFIDLNIKCINDGKLLVKLTGPYVVDKLKNKFPVYIDYTNFEINGKKIIDKNTLVNQNEPFTYYEDVKDGEIINLKISWLPFNKNSVYNKEDITSTDENQNNKNNQKLSNKSKIIGTLKKIFNYF